MRNALTFILNNEGRWNMHKQAIFFALIAILASGCRSGPSALDEAATMVAGTVSAVPPTGTPLPTSTPSPTNTPLPRNTTTPNPVLTATVEAYEILSAMDVWLGSNSGIPYRDGFLVWRQSEPIAIEMKGPQKDLGVLHPIGENIEAANFIFKSDVTWKATGILICGLAFRMDSDIEKGRQYQYYFYRLRGLPAYFIDVYEHGVFKNSISGAKFLEGLDPADGATNGFILVAHEEQFIVFINGKRQGQFIDTGNQSPGGQIAFLAWLESRQGSCAFENSWLWVMP